SRRSAGCTDAIEGSLKLPMIHHRSPPASRAFVLAYRTHYVRSVRLQADRETYVVSAFRRTRHGPAEAGHYVRNHTRATRSTALKSAPPLAKLLTSAIGPGASTLSRASRSVAADGSACASPAIGGTRPTRPHKSAAAHAALPVAPNSPSAPFTDVTTARPQPNSLVSACASAASSARVAL